MGLDFDIVIAGAGPVGLATAIYARQAGLSAVVLDPRLRPEEKACGEGLMPRGREILDELGVELSPADYAPFQGIRFVDGDTIAEGRFCSGPGWGIRRTTLWRAMSQRASALGAATVLGERVVGWRREPHRMAVRTNKQVLSGGLLIGADGLHSEVRRIAQLGGPPSRSKRFGMRRHFAATPWSSFVEVHWDDLAEAYVTPVDGGTIGVAVLTRSRGRSYDELLDRFPALRTRLGAAPVLDPVRGAGPFDQRVQRRTAAGVALVGDAAGYVDPLTGEGLTLGFESAKTLVDVVARGGAIAEYEHAYRRLVRVHVLLTRGLLAIGAHPPLRRQLVRCLAGAPRLFDSFLAINAGERLLPKTAQKAVVRGLGSPST